MKIETRNNQRIIMPDNDMWLYNKDAQVISDKVYLGIEASETEWTEITSERKLELEASWYEDIPNDDEATKEDYQNALEELGVTL